MTESALKCTGVDAKTELGFDDEEMSNFTNDSAMMIAWERALESKRPDALFNDPLAAALAGTKGEKLSDDFGGMCKMFDMPDWPEFHKTWVAVRTRFIDDRIKECAAAAAAGTTPFGQVVNLGAGVDTRPFRLECYSAFPNGAIDVDMPVINQGKLKVMASPALGSPKPHCCSVETVDLDFLDTERTLATALVRGGAAAAVAESAGSAGPGSALEPTPPPPTRFDPAAPTIFYAEGLIMYLGAAGKVKLIEDVSAVAAPGSVFILQYMDASHSESAKGNPQALASALSVAEATEDLTKRGWEGLEFAVFGDDRLNFGRFPSDRFKPSPAFSFCVCRKGSSSV
mmetsp:Transcript_97607/g.304060  ORF Transcript_97607/g.304060 Transcript_97607/m.304060 type:complete len:342 (+) Transcript_97607:61-1086(+)